jgi:hypothetical protein
MGSLTSKPKAPEIVPVYRPYTPPSATAQADPAATESQANPESAASQTRAMNLLSRSRGRFGTIQTSFRGFLGETTSKLRKTLLGE